MPGQGAIPRQAFAPVIVVIPCPEDGCKPAVEPGEWLPRRCPGCGGQSIIGHGRRLRQSHDAAQDSIRVRRGRCKLCHSTVTALPAGCVPGAQYSLAARQQSGERLELGATYERAVPDCLDSSRVADPATVRRWSSRRKESLRRWLAQGSLLIQSHTILAWDFFAAARILVSESPPP